ncbi:MAG: hypothetical protein ACYDC3_09040 [Candidatus Binataceae bacterium]
MRKPDDTRLMAWQRKQHKHWRGSSTWHHLRLGRGISINVWTMKGLSHHVIEFGSVTEHAPKVLAEAKRAALRLARTLCLAGARRAEQMLREESRRKRKLSRQPAHEAGC